MAYTIYHADGTSVNVPDNAIDTEFYNSNANGVGKGIGTQLVGRNAINYGTPVAQNFLQLTENFAGTNIPQDAYALQGQLWFEKDATTPSTAGKLNVRISTTGNTGAISANWREVVVYDAAGNLTIRGGTVPVVNPTVGQERDGDTKVVGTTIYIYASGWKQVFPAIYS